MKTLMNSVVSQNSATFVLAVALVFHPSVFEKTQEMLGKFVKISNGSEPTLAGLVIHALVAFVLYTYLKKMFKKA
tara:strand:- start:149 stop:373 length:225 start_codon:yes stop_codon:yes gene_type:complete